MAPRSSRALPFFPASIWALALLCLLPELVLSGADWGLWGSARWRPMTYQYGAFWAGLLYGWRPNYAAQPLLMFASYGWLHAGPGHLIGNLGVLVALGPRLATSLGVGRFLTLWLACLLGGALGFALLTSSPAPMVGASGALFGLAGAAAVAEIRKSPLPRQRLLRGFGYLSGLLLLNAAAWALQGGSLAWETHLGGMLTGVALAAVWSSSQRDRATPSDL